MSFAAIANDKLSYEDFHNGVQCLDDHDRAKDGLSVTMVNTRFYVQWKCNRSPLFYTPPMLVRDAKLVRGQGDAGSDGVNDKCKYRLRLGTLPLESTPEEQYILQSQQFVADLRRLEEKVATQMMKGASDWNFCSRLDAGEVMLSLALFQGQNGIPQVFSVFDYATGQELDPATNPVQQGDIVMVAWNPAYIYSAGGKGGLQCLFHEIIIVKRFADWRQAIDPEKRRAAFPQVSM